MAKILRLNKKRNKFLCFVFDFSYLCRQKRYAMRKSSILPTNQKDKNMVKAHFKLFMLSLLLMLGVASCKDNDNSSDSDEAVVTEMVDPSTNWKHRDDPTFMAGIEGAPLAFQQALSSTFPQKAGSLGDAYIAVVGFSWALAHLEELNEFYDGGGLLLLLPPKDDDLPELGYESFVDWDELIWGTHTLYEDIFYLLDAPDEMTVVNEENQEVTVRTDKDLNYYNTRLTALVEWIDAPPSCSCVTTSPSTALTGPGPVRNM